MRVRFRPQYTFIILGCVGGCMAECHGQEPITTKVDQEMVDYIDESAAELGVSRAEFIRRMLDAARNAEEAGECPACGTELELDL
jgi:hypothetical protein